MKAAIGVAAVLLIAGGSLLALKLAAGDTSGIGNPGGPRGPASQAAAKLDALSLATAEETAYATRQAYLPFTMTTGSIELGGAVVRLSPQDSAAVTLNASGTGYCIVVRSSAPTSGASSTVVYVSTLGGLQPLVTSCPASF